MLQYQVWVEGSWSFKNPALRWKMPLGIWSLIRFGGGRISGTPVPCIVVDDGIHKFLTLKLQYQVWGGRILELQKPCFQAEDAFGHLEL